MGLEALISTYGYAAVALGTFLEGETVLVLGGFAAHEGYLQLRWVLASAFLGAWCGDLLYFHIGRAKGQKLLAKHPGWKVKADKILSLLRRYHVMLILGFRFLYGLRTITPFALGTGGVRRVRFVSLDFIGALAWAVSVGVMGYLFGHAFQVLLGSMRRYEMWIFLGLVVSGLIIGCLRLIRKKVVGKKSPPRPPES